MLTNSGHDVSFVVDRSNQLQMSNISGGPLDYNYPIHSVSLRFGLQDSSGSEHTIDGRKFPGEVISRYFY